jgi:hypothetical protein
MEEVNDVQGKRKRTHPPEGERRGGPFVRTHMSPFEVRRKAVQLCPEESFPLERGPWNGRGLQHLVQLGKGLPRAGRSRLATPAEMSRDPTIRLRATRHAILRILSFPPRYPAQPPSEATPSAKSSVI